MIITAVGIITIVHGLQMAFQYDSIICLTFSLITGGLLGTWWNIDGGIYKIGQKLENLVKRKETVTVNVKSSIIDNSEVDTISVNPETLGEQKNFAYAFLNSTVLFCVGAMAIIGSFQAGIEHNYTTIFTKSVLDGFMAIVFAASLGIGTIFSALSIFVYQGLLTLLSSFVAPYVSDLMLTELSACGGAMIVMIGINLLGLKQIKTANFLPGLIVTVIFVLIKQWIGL